MAFVGYARPPKASRLTEGASNLIRALILGITGLVVFSQVSAWANTPADQVRIAMEEVTRILQDPSLQLESKALERQALIRAVVSNLFDFPDIARRVLGRHWSSLTEAEHKEFVTLFRTLLEHTYLPKITQHQGERARFIGESLNEGMASVTTLVITRRGQEIPVTYRLAQHGGRWLIFDVLVEGVSLTANYRAQFDPIIQRTSFQDLINRIRQKLAAPGS